MVLHQRVKWLNLSDLSNREKDDILDMLIVPEGIFGSALVSIQQRCETRKKRTHRSGFVFHRKLLLHFCEMQDIPAYFHSRTAVQDPKSCESGTHPLHVHFDQLGLLVQPSSRSGCSATAVGRVGCFFPGQEENKKNLAASVLRVTLLGVPRLLAPPGSCFNVHMGAPCVLISCPVITSW